MFRLFSAVPRKYLKREHISFKRHRDTIFFHRALKLQHFTVLHTLFRIETNLFLALNTQHFSTLLTHIISTSGYIHIFIRRTRD